MLDDLLPYYEKELSHLRFLGQEFLVSAHDFVCQVWISKSYIACSMAS